MNEDARKNTSPELEVQNNELNEDQLDEATGGITGFTVIPILCNRRCAANLSHFYYAHSPDDVCPFCGAKDFIEI